MPCVGGRKLKMLRSHSSPRLNKRQPVGCRFPHSHTHKNPKNNPQPQPKSTTKSPTQPTKRTQRNSPRRVFRLHPLFLIIGFWYGLKGELFLFLLSALVAAQHECAHAFAAAKLGYKLNAIVLMPYGAVIDGDLRGISLKDEIFVAVCGPLCNLCTALFFIAIWWLHPTMYAFTDTACYSSLAIALVNLLPAYPLDGGRIFKCLLAQFFLKRYPQEAKAEKTALHICRIITLLFAVVFILIFILLCAEKTFNFTLLAFGLFLLFGAFGTADKNAVYDRLPIERPNLAKGLEIRRVALFNTCPIKDALRFISKGTFLVLEVYDEKENHLFNLSQVQLSEIFARAPSPYTTLQELYEQNFC